jgi:hypothetical protein
MLRVDLDVAGIPYRDAAGRVYDFHSLRCQTATLADAAGVSPRTVQRLMRHTTLEMTDRYTRPRAVDIEAAASLLPIPKSSATGSATDATRGKHIPLAANPLASGVTRAQNPVPARGCGFKSHLRY